MSAVLARVVADATPALLALASEEMFTGPLNLTPSPTLYLLANGWTLRGYLTAVDRVFSLYSLRVYYGFHAERSGQHVVVIRGTMDAIEWLLDADGEPVPHPVAGKVHEGFWSIYRTLEYEPIGQASAIIAPVDVAIRAVTGDSGSITVIGHSLGSALGSYLELDLARAGVKVTGRLFASPRPGDAAFAAAVHAAVPDHIGYVYARDLVPRLPAGFGYTPLTGTVELPGSDRIPDNPISNHHALSYAWLLNSAVPVPTGFLRAA